MIHHHICAEFAALLLLGETVHERTGVEIQAINGVGKAKLETSGAGVKERVTTIWS